MVRNLNITHKYTHALTSIKEWSKKSTINDAHLPIEITDWFDGKWHNPLLSCFIHFHYVPKACETVAVAVAVAFTISIAIVAVVF